MKSSEGKMLQYARALIVILASVCGVGSAISHAQSPQAATSEGGYAVTRSQTVANAPPGFVGRKTTDTETRVGNTPETDGKSSTFVMTTGGFARKCPTAEGIVAGNFEFVMTRDESNIAGANTRTHSVKRVLATLEGHVRDDATIEYINVDAEFTRGIDGTSSDRIRTRFTPGAGGSLDMEAMIDAVKRSGDMSIAVVISMAGWSYLAAQAEWRKPNECVDFAFDPATDTRALGPNESADVRTELRTKEGGVRVAGGRFESGALDHVGKVTPAQGELQADAPLILTYEATAKPKKGNGIGIAALSRAGIADGQWRIKELVKFEGAFTQTGVMSTSPGVYGINVAMRQKVSGRLVWTQEENPARARTFGDVLSTFYVPTDGEITVAIDSEGRSLAGSCVQEGSKTFAIKDLPPGARQYLVLEVAADGRYRMMLAMISVFLQFQAAQKCSGRVPLPPGGNRTVVINNAPIAIGHQEGRLSDEGIAGETAQPIVIGPQSYTGAWRFIKIQ